MKTIAWAFVALAAAAAAGPSRTAARSFRARPEPDPSSPGESQASPVGRLLRADPIQIVAAFPGDSAVGPKITPDNVGAAGPDHVVDFTCANLVVHDKKTGKVLSRKSQVEFWKDLGFQDLHPNDPRFLFDPLSGRWIGTIADDRVHHLYLAVSTTSDPTGPWKGIKTPFDSPDFGFRAGVDRNGYYGCWWNRNKDLHTMMTCGAIPKEDLIAAGGPDLSHVQVFPDLEIESFPATDLDPRKAPGAPEILLHREFGNSFSKMYLYKITWTGKVAAISKVQELPLGKTYFSPNGSSQQNQALQPAPGAPLRADEGRRTSCVYTFGDSVFSCNEAKRDPKTRPGIFWCEVRKSDGQVLQEGLIDSPDCDYLAPSLAVDARGNVGIGCTRSSASEFPSACVMGRKATDPRNVMGDPVLAFKGTTVFTATKPGAIAWGNYNSTCIDPADPTLFWTSQEYAGSSTPNQWSTCWVAFRLHPN
ncbi:MAG TPA: hypothetical protein VKU80_12540 [Planctomycetota bacterium]|nr:hypothetical protein [Planctomycetota bacterium]